MAAPARRPWADVEREIVASIAEHLAPDADAHEWTNMWSHFIGNAPLFGPVDQPELETARWVHGTRFVFGQHEDYPEQLIVPWYWHNARYLLERLTMEEMFGLLRKGRWRERGEQ